MSCAQLQLESSLSLSLSLSIAYQRAMKEELTSSCLPPVARYEKTKPWQISLPACCTFRQQMETSNWVEGFRFWNHFLSSPTTAITTTIHLLPIRNTYRTLSSNTSLQWGGTQVSNGWLPPTTFFRLTHQHIRMSRMRTNLSVKEGSLFLWFVWRHLSNHQVPPHYVLRTLKPWCQPSFYLLVLLESPWWVVMHLRWISYPSPCSLYS